MRTEYWASKTYIYMMAFCALALSFLCISPYVFLERSSGIETHIVASGFLVGVSFMVRLIYRMLKYPHVVLNNGKLSTPKGTIFSGKTVNLDEPFHVSEIRGNIGVHQDRKYIGIIHKVLPEDQYEELRLFLVSHEFNM